MREAKKKGKPKPRMMVVPEDWKAVRRPKRLPDGRLRRDYPHEVVVNLSVKQMAYAQWCAKQLYFGTEDFAYNAVVTAVQGWWEVMPEDFKKRVSEMED